MTARQQDASRSGIEQTYSEEKAIIDLIGQYQEVLTGLVIDCDTGDLAKPDECLADYTRRLGKMDAYVSRFSWAVSAAPVGPEAHQKVNAWKIQWWGGQSANKPVASVRGALATDFGRFRIRGSAGHSTNVGTSQQDYDARVSQCRANPLDESCPSLVQCQMNGFEHSECIAEVRATLKAFEDLAEPAFCAILVSLSTTRIEAMKKLSASPEAIEVLEDQLKKSSCQ